MEDIFDTINDAIFRKVEDVEFALTWERENQVNKNDYYKIYRKLSTPALRELKNYKNKKEDEIIIVERKVRDRATETLVERKAFLKQSYIALTIFLGVAGFLGFFFK